jgi:plasmid stability protein
MDDRTAKLVTKGIRMLPQREQDQVLTALLREASSEPPAFTRPVPAPGDVVVPYPMSVPLPEPVAGAPGPSTMLPVRLPPELHARLREWCAEQGFSMAGVVRGLVERFLDGQEKRPQQRPSAAAARSKRATRARG